MVAIGPTPAVEVVDGRKWEELDVDFVQARIQSHTLSEERGDSLTRLAMDQIVRVVLEPVVQTGADPNEIKSTGKNTVSLKLRENIKNDAVSL